jgi:DNA processing protein
MKTSWKQWEIKTILKDDFPDHLKSIPNCPLKLFYRGDWNNIIFKKSLAIVGSRRMSRYGREVIDLLMPDIVAKKTTVISGFMYGVDTQAHQTCVDLGGITVAVLGGGLNCLTPIENEKLYSTILEKGGLIISEYEPDFQPTLWSFPQRNRIVSGLSTLGVLVVEASIKSGSLITAKLALKQNRKVYALPGPINSSISAGTNWLIKSGGAKLVTEAGDIFEEKISQPNQQNLFKDYSDLSQLEKDIVSILEIEEVTVDELCQKLRRPVSEIGITISMMLMRDLITQENGKIYLS